MTKHLFVGLALLAVMLASITPLQSGSLPDCPYMLISKANKTYNNAVYIPPQLTDDVYQVNYSNIFYGFTNVYDTDLNLLMKTPCIGGYFWYDNGQMCAQKLLEAQTNPSSPAFLLERDCKSTIFERNISIYPNENFYCIKGKTELSFYSIDQMKLISTIAAKQNYGVTPIGRNHAMVLSTSQTGEIFDIQTGKTEFEYSSYPINYGDGICITHSALFDVTLGKTIEFKSLGIDYVYTTRIRKKYVDIFSNTNNSDKNPKDVMPLWRYSRVDGSVTEMKVAIPAGVTPIILDCYDTSVLLQDSKTSTLMLINTKTGEMAWETRFDSSRGKEYFYYSRILNTTPKKILLYNHNWTMLANLETGEIRKKIRFMDNDYPGEVVQCGERFFCIRKGFKTDEPAIRLFELDKNLERNEMAMPESTIESYSWSVWNSKIIFWGMKIFGPDSPVYVSYFFFDTLKNDFSPQKSISIEAGGNDKIIVSGKFLLSCFQLRQTLIDLETGNKVQVDPAPSHVCTGGSISTTDSVVYISLSFDNNRYSKLYSFDVATLYKLGQSTRMSQIERLDFATSDSVVCSSRYGKMYYCDCNSNVYETAGMPIMLDEGKLYISLNNNLISIDIATKEKKFLKEKFRFNRPMTVLGEYYYDGYYIFDHDFNIIQSNIRLRNHFVQNGKMFGQTSSNGWIVQLVPVPSFSVAYTGKGRLEVTNTRVDGLGDNLEGYAYIFGAGDINDQSVCGRFQTVDFGKIEQGQTKVLEFDDNIAKDKPLISVMVFTNGICDYRMDKQQNNDNSQYWGYVFDQDSYTTMTRKNFQR